MARLRRAGLVLSLAVVLHSQAGCLQTPMMTAFSGLPVETPKKDELPPSLAVQACLAVAKNLEDNGNEAGAVEQYEKVVRLDPANLQASRRLAVLYDRQCDFAKADVEYRKLVQARPRDPDLYNDWGRSYYLRNQWDEAEKYLRRALELDRNHARARSNLGLVLGHKGRYPEALEAFRAVVSEAEAHCNLAFVYWSQGKLEEARNACQTARQVNPACAKAGELLAQLDWPQRQAPDAVAAADAPRGSPGREAVATARGQGATVAASTNPDLPSAGPGAEGGRVVYCSPSGTRWVPVTPSKAAAEPAPAQGAVGVITWE
jgi:tetratricopeptide (TPR) repeat protein